MSVRSFFLQGALLLLSLGVAAAGHSGPIAGDDPPVNLGYADTPMLPGGRWRVHDGTRPQPPIVTPPPAPDRPVPPPSDARMLFDGKDLSHWTNANWLVQEGWMQPRGGDTATREEFGDCQLHVEWRTPDPPRGSSQGRGNSGIFLLGRYEVQVLDSYENKTYPDGQAGAVYGQYPPLVNASRRPGEWQTYDIFFTAPRFEGAKLVTPAYVTVLHNGVLVQSHTPILGDTRHKTAPAYTPVGPRGPIRLQDHGDPVRYRNIWIRPLGERP